MSSSTLFQAQVKTPLGLMVAVADEERLHLLEFVDQKGLQRELKKVGPIRHENNRLLRSLESELERYFQGDLWTFEIPIAFNGTPFQQKVWEELLAIPFGETRSYGKIAQAIGKPTAYRAVAQANGANRLAIVIPCHRVINADGSLSGYAGKVERKEWLLRHEQSLEA
jgi:AraC family transcriptional regulator, regulatory protein of adaptative response / methylated-DNA-[protein]-cysteine methyltransferase